MLFRSPELGRLQIGSLTSSRILILKNRKIPASESGPGHVQGFLSPTHLLNPLRHLQLKVIKELGEHFLHLLVVDVLLVAVDVLMLVVVDVLMLVVAVPHVVVEVPLVVAYVLTVVVDVSLAVEEVLLVVVDMSTRQDNRTEGLAELVDFLVGRARIELAST